MDQVTLDLLAMVIARSQIVVAEPESRLPQGYDEHDLAILDWIAADARAAREFFALGTDARN